VLARYKIVAVFRHTAPYRPRQQRTNPFSLMNHETRQRHRNTLKGRDAPPARGSSFVAFLFLRFSDHLSFFRPTLQPIHLSSSFIILLHCPPRSARPLFPSSRCSYSTIPAPVRINASFLKMILADRARYLFRIPRYLVHCTSREQKVT